MHRSLVIAVALVVGCGDPQLERMQDLKDEVCACKTPDCGEAAMKRVPQGQFESGPKMQRLAREMMDCMAKLLEQGRPTTDPDAPIADEPTAPETAAPASAGTP